MKKLLVAICIVTLTGCSAKQSFTSITDHPDTVCIVKHKAVRHPSFLEGMITGFTNHSTKVVMVEGAYGLVNNVWHPAYNPEDTLDCDETVFYVANWKWDIAMYLHYANIWTTRNKFAAYQVTPASGLNMSKFKNANERAVELVDNLYGYAP